MTFKGPFKPKPFYDSMILPLLVFDLFDSCFKKEKKENFSYLNLFIWGFFAWLFPLHCAILCVYINILMNTKWVHNDTVLLSLGRQAVAQCIWWAFTTTIYFLLSDTCVGTHMAPVIIVHTYTPLFSFRITELKSLIVNYFIFIYIIRCLYVYIYITTASQL